MFILIMFVAVFIWIFVDWINYRIQDKLSKMYQLISLKYDCCELFEMMELRKRCNQLEKIKNGYLLRYLRLGLYMVLILVYFSWMIG